MISTAIAKYIRMSPTKIRMVMRLVKGENAKKAMSILTMMNKKAAHLINKVLKSAIANAENKGINTENLFISKIVANPGPIMKRFRAASFGRATTIRKRTSHIIIELDTKEKLIQNVKVS